MEDDRKLLQDVKALMIHRYPRFASQIAEAQLDYNSNLPYHTAATDGKNIYFDPDYLANLTDDEKLFIIAHELMHVRFEHMYRIKDESGKLRNLELWNIATDAIINANLERDGFKIKEGYVNMPEALNYNAEEFYEKLLTEHQQNQSEQQSGEGQSEGQSGNGSGSNGEGKQQGQSSYGSSAEQAGKNQNKAQQSQGQGQGQGSEPKSSNAGQDGQAGEESAGGQDKSEKKSDISRQFADDHSLWEKAFKEMQKGEEGSASSKKSKKSKSAEKPSDKNNSKESNQNNSDSKNNNNNKNQSSKSGGTGNGQLTSQSVDELGDGDQSKWEAKIDELSEFQKNRDERRERAVREFQSQQNGQLKRFQDSNQTYGNLGAEKPILDWRELLKREVEKTELIWSQRRSIAENNYAYRLIDNEEEDEAETEVMIDVSGSVSDEMVKSFLRQLKPILKASKLKVGFFADGVTKEFQEIKKDKDIDNLTVYRPGYGTNMDVAVRAFSKKREVNKIIFTDGYPGTEPKKDLEKVNVIWLVYENRNFHPCCGHVINVYPKNLKINIIHNGSDKDSGR